MVAGDNGNAGTTVATITDTQGNAVGRVTDMKSAAVHWLFGQEANTVALFMILGAMAWASWYLITVGIPAHLHSIDAGYQRIAEDNRKQVAAISVENRECAKELSIQHEKAVDKLQQSFEKAIDKHEKAFSDGFRAAKGNGL